MFPQAGLHSAAPALAPAAPAVQGETAVGGGAAGHRAGEGRVATVIYFYSTDLKLSR